MLDFQSSHGIDKLSDYKNDIIRRWNKSKQQAIIKAIRAWPNDDIECEMQFSNSDVVNGCDYFCINNERVISFSFFDDDFVMSIMFLRTLEGLNAKEVT